MTDNEIIKAFESLYKKLLNVKYDLKITQKEFLALNRVDTLIHRQKAEIERLEREIEDLESIQEITPEAKYLVDTKADKVISLMNEIIKSQDQIKVEAIKEFAERLKEKDLYPYIDEGMITSKVIDDLVKEMTEDAGT